MFSRHLHFNKKNSMMKKIILSIIVFGAIIFLAGCGDDGEPKSTTLADLGGSWTITEAFGTEWQKGVGIVTPKAADPGTVNSIIVIGINPTVFQFYNPLFAGTGITLSGDKVTIAVGSDVLEFTLKNKTATSMQWDQREPNTDSDYRENNPGQFLYFQKFWTLQKN
jgi:hypothetical protein